MGMWHHLEDVHSIPKPGERAKERPRASEETPDAMTETTNRSKKCRTALPSIDIPEMPNFGNVPESEHLPPVYPSPTLFGTVSDLSISDSSSLFLSREETIFDTDSILQSQLSVTPTSSASLPPSPSPSPSPSSNVVDIEGVNALGIGEDLWRFHSGQDWDEEHNWENHLVLSVSDIEPHDHEDTARLPLYGEPMAEPYSLVSFNSDTV